MNLILKVSYVIAQAQCLANWGDCLFIYLFIDNMSWQVFFKQKSRMRGSNVNLLMNRTCCSAND